MKQKINRAMLVSHGNSDIHARTKYGSYVPVNMYGMAQAKNAMSYTECTKYNYKPAICGHCGKSNDNYDENGFFILKGRPACNACWKKHGTLGER